MLSGESSCFTVMSSCAVSDEDITDVIRTTPAVRTVSHRSQPLLLVNTVSSRVQSPLHPCDLAIPRTLI